MRNNKPRTSAFLKFLPLPLLIGVPLLLLLLAFWSVQQNNVNSLARQITDLKQQIDALPATVVPKDKLALEKDRLTLEKDRVNAQNAIYGTLVQAFGGAFFVVTAYLTWRNVKATEEKQVTERFSKAIELLGSEKIEIRLGGIYALERIAKDSPKDYWTIMEILTSFITEKTTLELTSEVQAALTVIKRRDFTREQDWQRIELPNTNLRRANLREANFSRAVLYKSNLQEADLGRAVLYKANLSRANLSRANLIGVNLIRANLNEANFSEADLFEANLRRAVLYKTNLSGANLIRANLRRAVLYKTNLSGANFSEADLSGANLSEAIALTSEQISKATTDEKTKLPTYLQAPTSLQPEPPKP